MCVCWQGAVRGLLRQQREAAALSAGDHRMADSQGRGAVGAAAHRRRRGGRPAPEGVPPGNVDCNTFLVQILNTSSTNIDWDKVFILCKEKLISIVCPPTQELDTYINPYENTHVLR